MKSLKNYNEILAKIMRSMSADDLFIALSDHGIDQTGIFIYFFLYFFHFFAFIKMKALTLIISLY